MNVGVEWYHIPLVDVVYIIVVEDTEVGSAICSSGGVGDGGRGVFDGHGGVKRGVSSGIRVEKLSRSN